MKNITPAKLTPFCAALAASSLSPWSVAIAPASWPAARKRLRRAGLDFAAVARAGSPAVCVTTPTRPPAKLPGQQGAASAWESARDAAAATLAFAHAGYDVELSDGWARLAREAARCGFDVDAAAKLQAGIDECRRVMSAHLASMN